MLWAFSYVTATGRSNTNIAHRTATSVNTPHPLPAGSSRPSARWAGGLYRFSVRGGARPLLRISWGSPCSMSNNAPGRSAQRRRDPGTRHHE
jgi:hypothetical protein